jgi:hypothetical protein
MTISYAWEKFYSAVRTLVLIPEPLRDRLVSAATYDIMHVRPERDLPDELHGKFDEIMKKLTSEGSISDSVNSLSDDEVKDVADKIISLYDHIVKIEATTPNSYLKDYNR